MILLYILVSYISPLSHRHALVLAAPLHQNHHHLSLNRPVATLRPRNAPLYPNSTTLGKSTVGWVAAPQVRGTFDLLLSCLTTLSLCVWTAYHPNVGCGTTKWRRLRHRVWWMVAAVFVPELVLKCAWEQWWYSRQLRNDVKSLGDTAFDEEKSRDVQEDVYSDPEQCYMCGSRVTPRNWDEDEDVEDDVESAYHLDMLFGESESVETSRSATGDGGSNENPISTEPRLFNFFARRYKNDNPPKLLPFPKRCSKEEKSEKTGISGWTMEQASFAMSGGFAVDSSSFLPDPRVTFTPAGLRLLALLGLLPDEPPETVTDKSKADYVAKILVLIQAGWFLVQCIARLGQKLPLTLLEVHVLAHVFCAFCMYLLWIQKPYDVGSPILCKDGRVIDLAALLSLDNTSGTVRKQTRADIHKCVQANAIQLSEVVGVHNAPRQHSSTKKYLSDMFYFMSRSDIKKHGPEKCEEFPSRPNPENTFDLTPITPSTSDPKVLEHLRRANAAIQYLKSRKFHFLYVSKGMLYQKPDPENGGSLQAALLETSIRMERQYVVRCSRSNLFIDGGARIQDVDGITTVDGEGYKKLWAAQLKAFAVMSVLYGALHLAAWAFKFPTKVEMWFWRSAGLAMAATPLAIVASLFLLEFRIPEGKRTVVKWLAKLADWVLLWCVSVPLFLVATAGLAVYPVARGFVLAESFASLRATDPRTYQTVVWTNFIPHAG